MDKFKQIQDYLFDLEYKKNIRILLAVESGSRAWGFASKNSDWDVRIIYTREHQWYLSLDSNWNQTMEAHGPDDIDLHGWILSKALYLMNKGNSAIHEWINSPIVYADVPRFYERMQVLSKEYFNPLSACWHYNNLASGNYHRYIENERECYKLKRLLYVWRATLVAKYIYIFGKFPGTPIDSLLDNLNILCENDEIKAQMKSLIEFKKSGTELGMGNWNEFNPLVNWLANECSVLKNKLQNNEISANKKNINDLNKIFREYTYI